MRPNPRNNHPVAFYPTPDYDCCVVARLIRRIIPIMERLQNFPLVKLAANYPRLSAWVVLSVGMVALLVNEARDVGLLPTQWLSLIVATVLVAGACVWIISWEDEDEIESEASTAAATPETNDKDGE